MHLHALASRISVHVYALASRIEVKDYEALYGPDDDAGSDSDSGVVVPLLGWPECTKTRRFHSDLTKILRLRRAVFVFCLGGPGPSEQPGGDPLTVESKTHRPGTLF